MRASMQRLIKGCGQIKVGSTFLEVKLTEPGTSVAKEPERFPQPLPKPWTESPEVVRTGYFWLLSKKGEVYGRGWAARRAGGLFLVGIFKTLQSVVWQTKASQPCALYFS